MDLLYDGVAELLQVVRGLACAPERSHVCGARRASATGLGCFSVRSLRFGHLREGRRQAVLVDEHFGSPFPASLELRQLIEQQPLLLAEHAAHALLVSVERAQAQRQDRRPLERLVEHALVGLRARSTHSMSLRCSRRRSSLYSLSGTALTNATSSPS